MSFFFIDDTPTVSAMAFQASATSTATTITCPTVQAGDVGVLIDWSGNSTTSAPAQVIPSGFTLLISEGLGSSGRRGTASYKIFDGTESGSSLTGQTGTLIDTKVLLVFRPDAPIITATPSTWLSEVTTGNPSAQSIAATGQPAPLIRIAGAASNTAIPTFSSGTFDATVAAATRLRAGYAVQNSSPATDSVDIPDDGTNWLVSGYLALS